LLYPEEGKYTAHIPAFGLLTTYGDTVAHALAMAKDAIEVVTRGLTEDGEDVPDGDMVPIVASVEVASVEAVVA